MPLIRLHSAPFFFCNAPFCPRCRLVPCVLGSKRLGQHGPFPDPVREGTIWNKDHDHLHSHFFSFQSTPCLPPAPSHCRLLIDFRASRNALSTPAQRLSLSHSRCFLLNLALYLVLLVYVAAMPSISPGFSTGEVEPSDSFRPVIDALAFQKSPSRMQHVVESLSDKTPRPTLPPKAKRIPRPLILHNDTLIDNYHWMHQLGQDPDVAAYIQAETDYTNQWIERSGVASLQNQLEWEMRQIQKSINFQRCSSAPVADEKDDPLRNLNRECLETSEFWDLDHWRYWLDASVGEYGVYKRRPTLMASTDSWQVEADYFARMDGLQQQYMALPSLVDPLFDTDDGAQEGGVKIHAMKRRHYCPDQPEHEDGQGVPKTDMQCKPQPEIEVVLDINRLAKEVTKVPTAQFSFGTIEIQPYHTMLQSTNTNDTLGNGGGKHRPPLMAYSYDITGDERYHIRITTVPQAPKRGLNKTDNPPELDNLGSGAQTTSFDPLDKVPHRQSTAYAYSPSALLLQNDNEGICGDKDHCIYESWDIKDAGPEVRWVRLGSTLYLYYIKLDRKGLPREVWRVKVVACQSENPPHEHQTGASSTPNEGSFDAEQALPHQEPKSELVMREEDERNVLSLSLTNDQRFVIIESSGQTSSHSYFLNVGSPEQGWQIIRQGEEDVVYKVEHHSGYFYIRTNLNGAYNFKVIRIPVQLYVTQKHDIGYNRGRLFMGSMRHQTLTIPTAPKCEGGADQGCSACFLASCEDDTVIDHDENEFLERFEVFVEHFAAWIWLNGLQEIRVFLAPQADCTGKSEMSYLLPLKELQRIRPYHPDFKIAAVMPSNIRYEEQRLMRDFFTTRLRYSNSSFVHPWAIYELDMHLLSVLSEEQPVESSHRADWVRLNDVTRLVYQDPFPIGVQYGKPPPLREKQAEDKWQSDFVTTLKDNKREQEKEMAKFTERRIMVPSRHEELPGIPISVIYHSSHHGPKSSATSLDPDFPRSGAFVTSYGAYGTLTVPSFDPTTVLPLLHRGLIYVKVHPRGDGVLGPAWYENGKMQHKRNTFYDVEDVLKYLRDSGMVSPDSVVIQGRSAGGLVSGWMANRWGDSSTNDLVDDPKALINQNIVKEMVKVVLAQVPFMDVIADMSDPDIPWVEYEWNEWGSPIHSRDVFEVMKQYSPYDCIKHQPYPAMMIMGGLADSRVSYAEPLKYVAKLRSVEGKVNECHTPTGDPGPMSTDQIVMSRIEDDRDNKMCTGKKETPLLLRIEDGGHFSGSPSLWMAFALHQLGAEKVLTDFDTN